MGRSTRIPVRVHRPNTIHAPPADRIRTQPWAGQAAHQAEDLERRQEQPVNDSEFLDIAVETVDNTPAPIGREEEGTEYWKDRALRLQAEMENFRRRQGQLAQERIDSERRQLLTAFLETVDDLERALAVPGDEDSALRQGLEVTHRAALQLLEKQGVEQVEALGQRFDPNWHEAIATVRQDGAGASETVVQVQEPGYRQDGGLLRPAKVVVAI